MAEITAGLGAGTRVTLSARGHRWPADEPPEAGGGDTGPSPYELLLGSLGACTALTLRLYARHKGIPLEAVDVVYRFERVHARDCAECESRGDGGRIEVIRARVRLTGDLDEAQRRRLEQIVSRCPVHRTLQAGVQLFEEVGFA